jgi:hypothetical protein
LPAGSWRVRTVRIFLAIGRCRDTSLRVGAAWSRRFG